MFYEKPVVAAGDCFWAIESNAKHAETVEKIKHILSDPAKVASCLISNTSLT